MDKKGISELTQKVKESVIERMDSGHNMSDVEIRDVIAQLVFENDKQNMFSLTEKQKLIKQLYNNIRRLDVLQPLIDDASITEIMVNGHKNIFVEKDGYIKKLPLEFEDSRRLEDVIQTIVAKVNRTVNEASPMVDARLDDGSRVSVVLPPISLCGPILTIRRFPEKPILMEDLIEWETIDADAAAVLEKLVKAKYNIFICGGTGSGKTTFLNALSNFIGKDERIITIEDSAELQIQGIDNIVKLETRNSNTEGKGEITIRDLIKCSLRMRPERIIVGEVRGQEALDMLQAMNTGHDGSLSTGHANSTSDMLSRLETMVLSAASIPLESIRKQIASALDIIIHISRLRDKSRRVVEISEVVGCEKGQIVLNTLFSFQEQNTDENGRIAGSLVRSGSKLYNTHKLSMAGMKMEL
ncbi:MAG: CpaF family protein [Bacillota bacterium]